MQFVKYIKEKKTYSSKSFVEDHRCSQHRQTWIFHFYELVRFLNAKNLLFMLPDIPAGSIKFVIKMELFVDL